MAILGFEMQILCLMLNEVILWLNTIRPHEIDRGFFKVLDVNSCVEKHLLNIVVF